MRASIDPGAAEDAFLTPALVEALAVDPADAQADEEAWTLAAAPSVDFRAHPSSLGRLWVDEVMRTVGGSGFFRQVWERAAGSGEAPLTVALRMLPDAASHGPALREDTLLVRAAARFYAGVETEAAPSHLRRFDLESGAPRTRRRRSPPRCATAPSARDPTTALRVAWPGDAGAGRRSVPRPGPSRPTWSSSPRAMRSMPLSGVARVVWVVAGSPQGGGGLLAPAAVEEVRSDVFTGLEARASGVERPRLTWRTGSHEGMWGWAIFREELKADGRIARTGPDRAVHGALDEAFSMRS